MELYLVVLAVVLSVVIYYKYFRVENMTDLSESDKLMVDKVFKYIRDTDEDFKEYLKFLEESGNSNLKLIDTQLFNGLKFLKNKKMLTKTDIISAMQD